MLLNELTTLEDIEHIESVYEKSYGIKPYNISWWDPSAEFRNRTESALRFPLGGEAVRYTFSYSIDCHSQLLTKLGFANLNKACLITPSGSSSLLCAIKRIKDSGHRRIVAVAPHYFTLEQLAEAVGLRVEKIHIKRREGEYSIGEISLCKGDVLWVTNPIYCTGKYYSTSDIAQFKRILDSGFEIFADECLAKGGMELSRHLGYSDLFTGIYCPHKTVCINGVKFSCIVCPEGDERYYEQWSDILFGCLGSSNVVAIKHYLSDNFDAYSQVFDSAIASVWHELMHSVSSIPGLSLDVASHGYLRLLLFPDQPASLLSGGNLRQCIMSCGTSFIPSTRSHCPADWGLGFRINLSSDSQMFRGALYRLLVTLSRL